MKYSLILLALLVMLLSPVYADQAFTEMNKSLNYSNSTSLTQTLEEISGDITAAIEKIQEENQKSAQALSNTGISGEAATAILDTKTSNVTYAHSSLIISPDGIVTASSPSKYAGLIGKNLSYQPETRYVLEQKKPVITNIFLLEEGFYGISISYPIFSKDQDYLGYTDITIRPDEFFNQIIIPITEKTGYEAYINQINGTTIYENNEVEIGKNILSDPLYGSPEMRNLSHAVIDNKSGTAVYTFWNKFWNKQVPRETVWDTLSIDNQNWRIGVVRNINAGDNALSTVDNQTYISGNISLSIDEMTRFVRDAADYARKIGQVKACAEFNNLSGPYVSGDKSIFGYDMDSNALALPYQQGLLGKNRSNLTDVNGLAIMPAMANTARDGGGYLYFVYPNPAHENQNQLKLFRVEPVDKDWYIVSGIFMPWVKAEQDQDSINNLISRVKNAAAHVEKVGKEQAIRDFNDLNGTYADEENYIFAYDYNGTTLALPYQADLIGKDRKAYTDTYGSRIINQEIMTARDGGGFVYVVYYNPKSGENELKLCYVLPAGDNFLVGSGLYTGKGLEE